MLSFEDHKKIQNHWQNYEAIDNESFFSSAYNRLMLKSEWEPIEYNFLSWLNHSRGLSVPFNTPKIPEIANIEFGDFSKDYLRTSTRKLLFERLGQTIKAVVEQFKIEDYEIVIGGSFVEQTNGTPGDIDVILLVPSDSPFELHESFLYSNGMVSNGVDLKILPINFSFTKFKAYSNIIHLGNQVRLKNLIVSNNDFAKRRVVKLSGNIF